MPYYYDHITCTLLSVFSMLLVRINRRPHPPQPLEKQPLKSTSERSCFTVMVHLVAILLVTSLPVAHFVRRSAWREGEETTIPAADWTTTRRFKNLLSIYFNTKRLKK